MIAMLIFVPFKLMTWLFRENLELSALSIYALAELQADAEPFLEEVIVLVGGPAELTE